MLCADGRITLVGLHRYGNEGLQRPFESKKHSGTARRDFVRTSFSSAAVEQRAWLAALVARSLCASCESRALHTPVARTRISPVFGGCLRQVRWMGAPVHSASVSLAAAFLRNIRDLPAQPARLLWHRHLGSFLHLRQVVE
ncbi:hypothetical protein MTO96_015676 [Rhipicephalus appendiculatus]